MKLKDFMVDGHYELNGAPYDDAESLIQCGILGFCGCGSPKENLAYIFLGLEIIHSLSEYDPSVSGDFTKWFSIHKSITESHFKRSESEYFFYYWCNKEGLTEHGGSVPGWLTDKGKELLGLLRSWINLGDAAPIV